MRALFFFLIILTASTWTEAQDFQWGVHLQGGIGEVYLAEPGEVIDLPSGSLVQKEGAGFGIGIYSRMLVNEWLSLSSSPGILFQETAYDRLLDDGNRARLNLYSVGITLPVAFEFEFGRGKWRPHFSAGVGVFISIDTENKPQNVLRDEILFGSFSAGISCRMSGFNLRPELFFNHSLSSLSAGTLSRVGTVPPYSAWRYFGFRVLFYGNRNI